MVTDHNINCLYKSFVNSECSKNAIPNFLAYLWIILFVEALWLFILDNFWLKIPLTSSAIETFVDLVMACYDSPCPNFEVTFALFQSNYKKTTGYVSILNDDTPKLSDELYNLDFLPDCTTTKFRLTSIPKGVFVLTGLEELHLSRNLIKKIDVDILALKNLKVLRLDVNKLQTIAPNSLTKLENFESLDIDGNHKLEVDAFHQSLSCANLRNLGYPYQLKERIEDELSETEKEKLNYFTFQKNSKKIFQRGK
ncbi:leucine-rich repeat-containing protein 40-like [Xenia sp. Carnegie-2017]|uniref:leucine-rich repeat-containing protein 40-like n=1 Tax=Xenia sp. Carnegie-2017 TaxID=2897299 RepID=UPI001F0333E7|nr:leucine-rich repeat-containing protein 40-like [Xenia sp. Carnegie-2017]